MESGPSQQEVATQNCDTTSINPAAAGVKRQVHVLHIFTRVDRSLTDPFHAAKTRRMAKDPLSGQEV
jgi:hypothetical protein